ncbi:MAG: hypothetical protein WBP79_01695, partial [Candidatus Acidiferrales bacterium]
MSGPLARMAFRTLALLNLFEGLVGLVFASWVAIAFFRNRQLFGNEIGLDWIFYALTTISEACALALVVSSPFLWRLTRKGLFISIGVLLFELFYFVVEVSLSGHEGGFKAAMAGASGIGGVAFGFQLMTLYPLIAAVL